MLCAAACRQPGGTGEVTAYSRGPQVLKPKAPQSLPLVMGSTPPTRNDETYWGSKHFYKARVFASSDSWMVVSELVLICCNDSCHTEKAEALILFI